MFAEENYSYWHFYMLMIEVLRKTVKYLSKVLCPSKGPKTLISVKPLVFFLIWSLTGNPIDYFDY